MATTIFNTNKNLQLLLMKNLRATLIVFFSIISFCIHSQEGKPNREKIKELKIAFLTEKLDLNVNEAKLFWPIYNRYNETLMKIRREDHLKIRKKIKEAGSLDNISDEDAEKLIKEKLHLEKMFLKERKNFVEELSLFLPYNKILKFQIAEKEFGKKLLAKYKRGRNNK